MAGIFPPADKGGRPPGGNICNGFSPTHPVIGEGPLYIAADCTTIFTDCQLNSIVSELLALKDVGLDIPWNANRVDNLGTALRDAIAAIYRAIDARVLRSGDTMEGPLTLARDPEGNLEAATRRYVDNAISVLNSALRQYTSEQVGVVTGTLSALIAGVDQRKINRDGDTMTGPLILSREPQLALEAATRAFVITTAGTPGNGGGNGGGGGIPEAPFDDQLYGRRNQTWVPIIDDGEV